MYENWLAALVLVINSKFPVPAGVKTVLGFKPYVAPLQLEEIVANVVKVPPATQLLEELLQLDFTH